MLDKLVPDIQKTAELVQEITGGQQGAGHRLRADQQGSAAAGEGDSAECLRSGRDGFDHRGTDRTIGTTLSAL